MTAAVLNRPAEDLIGCACDCMSCVNGQHCVQCRTSHLVTASSPARGHAYSPSNADGGGPCSVCGYGPAAPQHQATYGLTRWPR